MRFDVTVIGVGPVGLAAAVALSRCGFRVAACGPPASTPGVARDARTAAIFGGGVAMLENLGIWPRIAPVSQAILAVRMIDDTGGLLRAPETLLSAADAGEPVLGYNIPNADLVGALESVVLSSSNVRLCPVPAVQEIVPSLDHVAIALPGGEQISAPLVVGADGRHSPSRLAAGIGIRRWSYDQSAIVCRFDHSRSHDDTSNELHRPAGPLTTVPLPGQSSSLVWVERTAEAERLVRLSTDVFREELQSRLKGLLGRIGEMSERKSYALSGMTATPLARNRIALAGEAGHVIPPIGAQGLNLGLRDVAVLTDCLIEARSSGDDIGGDHTLGDYERRRRSDIELRTAGVDWLNRSLLSDFPGVHLARGAFLQLLASASPLRKLLVRHGLDAPGKVPSLMRRDPPFQYDL